MDNKFDTGKDVWMSPDSRFCGTSDTNPPAFTHGTVARLTGRKLPIRVRWDNGLENSYQESDLLTPDDVDTLYQFWSNCTTETKGNK